MTARGTGASLTGMRTAPAIAALLATLVLAGCGDSSEDKAQTTVCNARDDISKQVNDLKSLTPSTITTDAVTQSLTAIQQDLSDMAGAQKDLSSDRREQVQSATQTFTSSVKDIAGQIGSSMSAADPRPVSRTRSSSWPRVTSRRSRRWTAADGGRDAHAQADHARGDGGRLVLAAAPAASVADVNYGPISHKGLKSAGPASTSLKLPLQVGLKVNQGNIADAVKAASNPASSSYGKYPSLSTLPEQVRRVVVEAQRRRRTRSRKQNVSATVDVTHLRVSATVSIGKAQKLFGTHWKLYETGGSSQLVALPVNTPKLPKGMSGNVDTVAGMRLTSAPSRGELLARGPPAVAQSGGRRRGGTPTRTGTPGPAASRRQFPDAVASPRPVPEPDPDGLRDRAAAGRRPARPGRPRRDRRRGADARPPTSTVPLCFGVTGTA